MAARQVTQQDGKVLSRVLKNNGLGFVPHIKARQILEDYELLREERKNAEHDEELGVAAFAFSRRHPSGISALGFSGSYKEMKELIKHVDKWYKEDSQKLKKPPGVVGEYVPMYSKCVGTFKVNVDLYEEKLPVIRAYFYTRPFEFEWTGGIWAEEDHC